MFQEISGNLFNVDTIVCSGPCAASCPAVCESGCGGDYPKVEIRMLEKTNVFAEVKAEYI